MALDWPDVSNAGITDAAVFRALADALRERQAASGGGEFPLAWSGASPATPALETLRWIRACILSLATGFVRIDDETYPYDSWSDFPICYTAEDLYRGEHSLALLPAPGTPEGDPTALAAYRTFLANCIWWLRRFRYVDASSLAYCTRRCEANAERSRNEDSIRPWMSYDTGTDPNDAMQNPSVSTVTRAGALTVSCWHRSLEQYSGDYQYVDSGPVFVPDAIHYRQDQVVATAYSGFVVRNASCLDGELLLIPCFDRPGDLFPIRRRRTAFVDSSIPYPHGASGAYEKTYGELTDEATEEELHDGTWRRTRRSLEERREHWTDESGRWRLEETVDNYDTRTRWNAAGTRSFVTSDTESHQSGIGGDQNDFSEVSSTVVYDFDGFGYGSLGIPLRRGTVPANGSVVAVPESSAIPAPDAWDLSDLRQWRHGAVPRRHFEDDVEYTAGLRLVPVLDFNSSYRYQDTTA